MGAVIKYGLLENSHNMNKNKLIKNLPFFMVAIIGIVMLKLEINAKHFEQENKVIAWDVVSYYILIYQQLLSTMIVH